MQSRKIYKGVNSNLIDCNAWSFLPCIFCVIALQSINLELPPLYICVIALQSIRLELTPLYIFRDCIAIY